MSVAVVMRPVSSSSLGMYTMVPAGQDIQGQQDSSAANGYTRSSVCTPLKGGPQPAATTTAEHTKPKVVFVP
jgi:hypothetical protein